MKGSTQKRLYYIIYYSKVGWIKILNNFYNEKIGLLYIIFAVNLGIEIVKYGYGMVDR